MISFTVQQHEHRPTPRQGSLQVPGLRIRHVQAARRCSFEANSGINYGIATTINFLTY